MENTKCFQLFISLHKDEKMAFKKWIHSPIANQHDGVTAVFEYLFSKKYLNSNIVQKEKIFASTLYQLAIMMIYDFGIFYRIAQNALKTL
jgi:hypothetical protein